MTKRLVFIDVLRGIAIFYVIILHAFLFRVVHQYKPLFEEVMTTSSFLIRFVATPFIFLSLWGSFFCMITGIVFVYRVRSDYETSENFQAVPYFLKRGLSGLLLIVLQYVWLTLLSPKSIEHPGLPTYSLLTGSIEQWRLSSIDIMHYSTTGMIESIGWIVIVLSVFCFFIYRKKQSQPIKFFTYIGIALLISIGISVFFEIWIKNPTDFFDDLYDRRKIFQVIFLLKLTRNRFSFFPLIIFGLCGGIIGYYPYNAIKDRWKLAILFSVGITCILAYVFIYIGGFDMMGGYTSDYIPLPLHLLNLGSQFVIIGIFYLIFKRYQSRERTRDIGIVRFFRMYSSTSLTIYIFEPFTSVLLYHLIKSVYAEPINEHFYVWMGFLLLNVLVWYGILALWRKFRYKFSVEWSLEKLKETIKF